MVPFAALKPQKLIAIRIRNKVPRPYPQKLPIEFALPFKFHGGLRGAEHFDLHKTSESFYAVNVELSVPDKIDLAPFINHG